MARALFHPLSHIYASQQIFAYLSVLERSDDNTVENSPEQAKNISEFSTDSLDSPLEN